MNFAFILLSLVLAWRIECQGIYVVTTVVMWWRFSRFIHGIVPYADLHVLINVSGENTTTANRLAVAEENFDDNEGGEEVVFSPARPLAMYGLREPINNEIIKRFYRLKQSLRVLSFYVRRI